MGKTTNTNTNNQNGAEAAAVTRSPKAKPARRLSSRRMALEQRMLFDGLALTDLPLATDPTTTDATKDTSATDPVTTAAVTTSSRTTDTTRDAAGDLLLAPVTDPAAAIDFDGIRLEFRRRHDRPAKGPTQGRIALQDKNLSHHPANTRPPPRRAAVRALPTPAAVPGRASPSALAVLDHPCLWQRSTGWGRRALTTG